MAIDRVFQAFPQLTTERLILRQLASTDAEAVFKVLSDPDVTQFYDDDAFTDLSQAIEQIEAWNTGFKERRCVRWGIARKQDNVVIGSCGYYGFHYWHQRAGLGYELASAYWRQGFMTEALRALIAFGFEEMTLNRLQATVMPENLASVKLLEKLGFHQEGLLREYENWANKGFVDVFMFSLLRHEYKNLYQSRE